MEKYVCAECGEIFDEDEAKTIYERDTGEGGYGNVIWSYDLCPFCGSEDLEEARECPICGEYHGGESDVCDTCLEDIETAWKELLTKFPDGADAGEIARYIAEVLE